MQAVPSPFVRCFGCRRQTARTSCSEVGGLLYGPCCAKRAREAGTYWCSLCGCMFCEEAMFSVDVCKLCEAGL
jgi:hypothetical protein